MTRAIVTIARIVWVILFPLYLTGMILTAIGERIPYGESVQAVGTGLMYPSYYLYERFWAP